MQSGDGDVVKTNFGERGGVARAAARIGIHQIDQLAHGVLAISHHQRGFSACRCNQLVAHHQQTVIVAGQEFFDHHSAIAFGGGIGFVECTALGDVDGDPFALVAILRLHHHRQAHLQGNVPGFVRRLRRATQGHGHASGMQQFFGQVFVLGNRFGNGTGGVNFCGLNAPLL